VKRKHLINMDLLFFSLSLLFFLFLFKSESTYSNILNILLGLISVQVQVDMCVSLWSLDLSTGRAREIHTNSYRCKGRRWWLTLEDELYHWREGHPCANCYKGTEAGCHAKPETMLPEGARPWEGNARPAAEPRATKRLRCYWRKNWLQLENSWTNIHVLSALFDFYDYLLSILLCHIKECKKIIQLT